MNNLTKDQINLFTAIGSVLLLIIFFAFPAAKASAFGFEGPGIPISKMLSGGGFLFVIGAILTLVCPIYLILEAFKDKKELASLKSIFVVKRKLAGILLIVGIAIVLLGILVTEFVAPAWGLWIYIIIAAAICYLGTLVKE